VDSSTTVNNPTRIDWKRQDVLSMVDSSPVLPILDDRETLAREFSLRQAGSETKILCYSPLFLLSLTPHPSRLHFHFCVR
jgi:hypothetical protein